MIQTSFREISRRLRITDATPYDWEPTGTNRFVKKSKDNLTDDVPPPMRGEPAEGGTAVPLKKYQPPKASTPKNTTGTTTTTEDDDDEKEKNQESTNLEESPSVMLKREVFDKNQAPPIVEGMLLRQYVSHHLIMLSLFQNIAVHLLIQPSLKLISKQSLIVKSSLEAKSPKLFLLMIHC